MARYKAYDLNQAKMIPISYSDQIVARSFEHALNELVEEHLDLSVFEQRYANDATGRLAYDPKVLLKIVLYGYYKGIISSRALAEACRRNVVFMAISADTRPHFTTLAAFVSELDREIVSLFRDVLLYASELGLIGSTSPWMAASCPRTPPSSGAAPIKSSKPSAGSLSVSLKASLSATASATCSRRAPKPR
jgi:transposase